MKDINLLQYAKMYLVYVQVARPFTTWKSKLPWKLVEPVLLQKIFLKNGIRTLVAGMARHNA